MKKIESEKLIINNSQEKIYEFLSNFNNFGKLMPEQIINWQSTETSCSFTIKGMTDLSMQIKERIPHHTILITSFGKTPFDFELKCSFDAIEEMKTQSQLIFFADLNPMLSMMASKPLENFVNMLNTKLKQKAEEEDF
ncbi:MAG: SRPBCC family protein [Bacteroidetes bacterium]|nr:SRPBCC family protein [Bacteroidota bacterium]